MKCIKLLFSTALLCCFFISSAQTLTKAPELVTRRMDEMTSREIQFYFQSGGDLVFIPFGPISGHGSFIPVGMHAHWANAMSLLMAEKANGLVYPMVTTCYAGATRTFRGTVSFPINEQAAILKRIALTLLEQGFKRIVLVAGTTPEHTGGYIAAREIFDETEHPVWFIICENLLREPEVRAIYQDYPGNFGETQLAHASLRILGRERPIPYAELAKQTKRSGGDGGDQPDEILADSRALRRFGSTIGFRYFDESQHGNGGNAGIIHNGEYDVDMAERVMRKSAELVVPILDNLSNYVEWMGKQPVQYIVPNRWLND